ncbi:uncharacterized protein PO1_contig-013-4 [Mycobacterium sp. PO1]|nr:uncharacterized protein PO1_contig-013-4 [Mycobacterium sp. PO1]GFM25166.1 uncharacterized protein PO2_contig-062-4 [Mycobacterium sp. PO2]
MIGAAGLSAAGELEAARIYTAPAMLLVVGLGAYLFSSYARDKQRPLKEEIRSVDRQVVVLGGWIAMLSICIAVAVPQVSPLIAGQQVSMTMTIGWLVYILSVATTSCYANLAAVRGFERATLAVRSFDSGLSVIFVIAAMWVYQKTDSDLLVEAAPFAIAVGSFIGGFILRRYVLRPGSAPSDAPS